MLCTVTDNLHLALLLCKEDFWQYRVDVLDFLATDSYDAVAILEAQLLGTLRELVAIDHILVRDILRAIRERDAAIDEKCQDYIHRYTCRKHQEALPSRLGAVLPRLWLACKLFLVHTLVDHTRNLAVAAQWQPSEAIFGLAPLLLPEREAPIEEYVELFDSNFEDTSNDEMSELVNSHQQCEAHKKL